MWCLISWERNLNQHDNATHSIEGATKEDVIGLDRYPDNQYIRAVNGISYPTDIDGRKIREAQKEDLKLQKFREQVKAGLRLDITYIRIVHSTLVTWFVYPRGDPTENFSRSSQLSLFYTLRRNADVLGSEATFWWNAMKRKITQYVTKCLVCQQVKTEHQRSARFLQPLPILEWNWEHITMDCHSATPCSPKGNSAICVIIDRLTK